MRKPGRPTAGPTTSGTPATRGTSSTSGSVTTETALIIVVAAVIVAAAVAVVGTDGGPFGDLVAWTRRRICRVLGEPCDAPTYACTQRVDSTSAKLGAVAAFAESDRSLGVRVEHLSDGTVRVVLSDDGSLGVGFAPGAALRFDVGSLRLSAGATVGGGVDVTAARDVAAVFPDDDAARSFLHRYRDVVRRRAVRAAASPTGAALRRIVDLSGGILGVGSDPAVVEVPGAWRETAVGGRARGTVAARVPVVASVEAFARLATEVRVRAPDGQLTYVIAGDADAAARAGTTLLPSASAQAAGSMQTVIEVTTSASGEPQQFTVRRADARTAGSGGQPTRRVEVLEARLDLTVPANREAVRRAVLDTFDGDANADLARRVARHGTTTRLVYEGTERRRGITAHARSILPGVGFDVSTVDEALELRSAAYRDEDGAGGGNGNADDGGGGWSDWLRCRP